MKICPVDYVEESRVMALSFSRENSSELSLSGSPSISTHLVRLRLAHQGLRTGRTSMLSKGYVLGKDALSKAKSFDEAHQVSASAAAKVVSLGKRIGINDKISAGAEAVRAIENNYHVSEKTKLALAVAQQTVSHAGTAVVNSRYFSAGALWVSGVLSKAAQAAADLGSKGTT